MRHAIRKVQINQSRSRFNNNGTQIVLMRSNSFRINGKSLVKGAVEMPYNQNKQDESPDSPGGKLDQKVEQDRVSEQSGQSTETQSQQNSFDNESATEKDQDNYGGQSNQPGLPDKNDAEWSPGSDRSKERDEEWSPGSVGSNE